MLYGRRAHLPHMLLVLNSEALTLGTKGVTVVGSTIAPGTLGRLPATYTGSG